MSQPKANTSAAKSTAKSTKKLDKKNKGLIYGVAAGAVVVVVAIVAAIVLLGGKPDYQKSYDTVEELYAKLQYFMNGSACEKLSNESGETDITEETLKGYIATCKTEVKEVSDLNRKLQETSGVEKDSEIKQKFDAYEAKWKVLVSNEDGLEDDLQAYIAMHKFVMKADEVDLGNNPEEMLELGDILVKSGNKNLEEYGKNWNEHARKVIDLMDKYKNASTSSERSKLQSELLDAADELEDFLDDTTLLEQSTNLNQENAEAMADAFEALYAEIEDKA